APHARAESGDPEGEKGEPGRGYVDVHDAGELALEGVDGSPEGKHQSHGGRHGTGCQPDLEASCLGHREASSRGRAIRAEVTARARSAALTSSTQGRILAPRPNDSKAWDPPIRNGIASGATIRGASDDRARSPAVTSAASVPIW